jgi:hypothetical protein
MNSKLNRNSHNLYNLLLQMEKRPGMYIGSNKLSDLYRFINGYTFCAGFHNIESEKISPPLFPYFNEFIRKKYNWFESTSGWCNMILEENENDEEEGLKVFYELFHKFRQITAVRIQKVKFTEENITHNESKGRRYGTGELVYKNPQEIYLVEYSQNFGFAYFVIDDGKNNDWLDIHKTEKDVLEIFKKQFGEIDNWEVLEDDLMSVVEHLMKIR